MELQNLANIRSGLVLSRKQSREPTPYRYPLINLRCIKPDGRIELQEVDFYEAKEPLKEEYLSQSGEIIVRLTAPYTAVLITEETAGMVIPSNFVVISIESNQLLPEFLYWLLNTQKVKRAEYESSTSNVLSAVKTKYFSKFELKLLPLEQQREIAQINLLSKRESNLLKRLVEEKQKYYTCLLERAYKNAKRGTDK